MRLFFVPIQKNGNEFILQHFDGFCLLRAKAVERQ